jgi:hypothetical protein
MAALAVSALAALALTFGAASAHGFQGNWQGTNLPGGVWTGSGGYVNGLYFEHVEAETTSNVCIGPVQKSGSGWITPLGWKCTGHWQNWEHVGVTGMAAVYNPNPGTISKFWAFYFYTG